MNNNKVLELCLSPDLGGLEIYMHRCSQALSDSFHVTSVIADHSMLLDRFASMGGHALTIKTGSRFSLITAYRLAQLIDEHKIDILHFHWTKDMPVAVLAKKLSRRTPKLVQSRHMTMTRFKNDPFHRFLYRHIDHILCVTQAVARQINTFIPADIRPSTTILYPGADLPSPMEESKRLALRRKLHCEDEIMIGLIGRITPDKGQYLLIEAMHKLVAKGLPVKAFIVGHAMSDNYLEVLRQKVSKHGLQNNITFLDFTNAPHEFMQTCDIMLTASKNETFGLVTVEAMQCGTAVIGANSGGTREIIDDNKTGLLFENENSDDLANKIELLARNTQQRRQLAQEGQKKAGQQFENEQHFRQLAALFDIILKKAPLD